MKLPHDGRSGIAAALRLAVFVSALLRATVVAVALAVTVWLLSPRTAFAQGETTSAIVGQVSDASGAAVPGAAVTVSNLETGMKRSATTDDSGRFDFPQLKPGTYSIRVEAAGFEAQRKDAVVRGLGPETDS